MTVSKKKEARNKNEIVGATIELLEKINYSSLTIEAVAERSGVAKTTIYRWWNHKSDLVFESFIAKTHTLFEFDLTKSIHENFVQQLLTLTSILDSGVGRALLMIISERKETAAEFVHAYLAPRRAETKKMLQTGIDKREIQADIDFDVILDMLYGPIFLKFIVFNTVPDQIYIEKLVTQTLMRICLEYPSNLEN